MTATGTSPAPVTTWTPSGPRVSSTTRGPAWSSIRAAVRRAALRLEPGEVLLGDLDHVAARQHPAQAPAVAVGVADDPRADVGVDHDERLSAELLDHRLQGGPRRLQREAQRPDVQDPDGGRQRGERHLGRQSGGRRGALVEAVLGAAGLVELGERQRGRLVGAHDGVEAHAVGGEHPLELGAEAVGREATEIGDRLAEAPDRARGIEGRSARMALEVVVAVVDEVVERLAADEDDVLGRFASGRRS